MEGAGSIEGDFYRMGWSKGIFNGIWTGGFLWRGLGILLRGTGGSPLCMYLQVVVKRLEERLILKMVVPLLIRLSQDTEM